MDYVVLDLEATCWVKGTRPGRQEVTEFGAVRVDGQTLELVSDFNSFVRPVARPELSDFCIELTGITQADVDNAPVFPDAFAALQNWVGEADVRLCTWGAYDVNQLKVDCRRHDFVFPERFESLWNLKKDFSAAHGLRPCGMRRALAICEIPLVGRHHRGIDDARNIAKVMVRVIESER